MDPASAGLGEPASPAARRTPPVEAEQLADLLRQQLVAQKPDHALARKEKWATVRSTWARELGAMLRTDHRQPAQAAVLIRWVFGDQGGSEFRFVVESAKALRSKWDRIETAMRRPRSRTNGEHVPAGATEDEVIQPRRRNL